MLAAQLKTTNKPVNHADFRPCLGYRSRAGSSRLTASGKLGGAFGARGVSTTSQSLASGAGQGSRSTPSSRAAARSFAARVVHDQKAFPNENTYNGTFLDGRMHGDGVYTWSDGTEYAGEFREGFVWGQGEKCWPNGRTYTGDWVQDMMWGNGEMEWPSGEKFSGQFCKGVFHGKGERSWPNGDRYTGDFRDGEQEGEGSFESNEEGWVYNGSWRHGQMCGEGKVKWPSGIVYAGEWTDGVRQGRGRLTWPDGAQYEGQFMNNCIEGQGRKSMPDGSWFEGNFLNGELEGHGKFHWADETEFEGLWHNSEVVGPGSHRFPDGTTITGVFESKGASGEGTKTWANGCVYTGRLLQNQISHYGVMKWPDGRCYVGHFRGEAMHGVGTLTWSDGQGLCRYKGSFHENEFQGHGLLEWSSQARYEGDFQSGAYHGSGVFEWPGAATVYRGQWADGAMHGSGLLATDGGIDQEGGEPFVYVGEFLKGNMEGQGQITFLRKDEQDTYHGSFLASKFHGSGDFRSASGSRLTGTFEDGFCKTGEKSYPSGHVYRGEMERDLEHGRGVLMLGECRLIGVWRKGKCISQLTEIWMPRLETPDEEEGAPRGLQKVFGGFIDEEVPPEESAAAPASAGGSRRTSGTEAGDAAPPQAGDQNQAPVGSPAPGGEEAAEPAALDEARQPSKESAGASRQHSKSKGVVVALLPSGDQYVGFVKAAGKKHGAGMYVYADFTAFKGEWADNVLEGVAHPLPSADQPAEAVKIHKMNQELSAEAERLKLFEPWQLPPASPAVPAEAAAESRPVTAASKVSESSGKKQLLAVPGSSEGS